MNVREELTKISQIDGGLFLELLSELKNQLLNVSKYLHNIINVSWF